MLDRTGYPLKFIQKDRCKDNSAHKSTYIYKFYSPKTKLNYIIRCEYHLEDVFAIKFYCKKDKKSDLKYSLLVNRGDVANILITCLKVIPILLQKIPNASFAIIGAPRIDKIYEEPSSNNVRFRVYSAIAKAKIGRVMFSHYHNEHISGYLLVNNHVDNVEAKKMAIQKMFTETYNEIGPI